MSPPLSSACAAIARRAAARLTSRLSDMVAAFANLSSPASIAHGTHATMHETTTSARFDGAQPSTSSFMYSRRTSSGHVPPGPSAHKTRIALSADCFFITQTCCSSFSLSASKASRAELESASSFSSFVASFTNGAIDFDALLLGGCFCHHCLLQVDNPCQNGGTCVNYNKQGYTCDCTAAVGFGGDHCHVPDGAAGGPSTTGRVLVRRVPLPPDVPAATCLAFSVDSRLLLLGTVSGVVVAVQLGAADGSLAPGSSRPKTITDVRGKDNAQRAAPLARRPRLG